MSQMFYSALWLLLFWTIWSLSAQVYGENFQGKERKGHCRQEGNHPSIYRLSHLFPNNIDIHIFAAVT